MTMPLCQVMGAEIAGISASVSALEFCSLTSRLSIGNECGVVRIIIFITAFFSNVTKN